MELCGLWREEFVSVWSGSERTFSRKDTEIYGTGLSQCSYVHQKSHSDNWGTQLAIGLGSRRLTDSLSRGTALSVSQNSTKHKVYSGTDSFSAVAQDCMMVCNSSRELAINCSGPLQAHLCNSHPASTVKKLDSSAGIVTTLGAVTIALRPTRETHPVC